jgi:hypothetical protein
MKNNLFRIDESEKDRILNLHLNATKSQYLSEQAVAPQQTKLVPKAFPEVNLKGGQVVTITDKSNNTPINWVVTPSQAMEYDENKKPVPVPNTLSLKISPEGLKNTYVLANVDCNTKKVSYRYKALADNYSNFNVGYYGRQHTGDQSKNALLQAMSNGDWTYVGPIAEMGNEFCQAIK